MAQAKNHINTLKQQLNAIESKWRYEKEEDWKEGEGSCIVAQIFGLDVLDYSYNLKHELVEKINDCIYLFQNEIYNLWQSGKLNHKEYCYCYNKSKQLLM